MSNLSYVNGSVRATCPDCGVASNFEPRDASREFGSVDHTVRSSSPMPKPDSRMIYQLLRCATCGRGAVAEVFCEHNVSVKDGKLRAFYPYAPVRGKIPKDVPKDLDSEFREAEQCAGIGAHRAALALLRSVLEKTVKANGYDAKGPPLAARLTDVHKDGLLTDTLKLRADGIKNVGNDILHDDWRPATADEVEEMHSYVIRILEAFYDHRPTVLAQLKARSRAPRPEPKP